MNGNRLGPPATVRRLNTGEKLLLTGIILFCLGLCVLIVYGGASLVSVAVSEFIH